MGTKLSFPPKIMTLLRQFEWTWKDEKPPFLPLTILCKLEPADQTPGIQILIEIQDLEQFILIKIEKKYTEKKSISSSSKPLLLYNGPILGCRPKHHPRPFFHFPYLAQTLLFCFRVETKPSSSLLKWEWSMDLRLKLSLFSLLSLPCYFLMYASRSTNLCDFWRHNFQYIIWYSILSKVSILSCSIDIIVFDTVWLLCIICAQLINAVQFQLSAWMSGNRSGH